MSAIVSRGTPLALVVNTTVVLLVIAWSIPTFGLLVSSLRDKDQLAVSGWWTALTVSERNVVVRASPPSDQRQAGAQFVIEGNFFTEQHPPMVSAFGTNSRDPTAYAPGEEALLKGDVSVTVNERGDYRLTSPDAFSGRRGKRLFLTVSEAPKFTIANYTNVLLAEGLGRSFINTLTVTIPATVIPILVAAFAAYALAWMEFPGRVLLLSVIVGLLVVPLQMALIPLLKLHNTLGIGKAYLGIWLAHTAFGLPLAIYLLRNYIAGLPKEIIESAKVDGATDFDIFRRIVLPLSFPALASFAIFQFLWVWNDLLVATVFLGNNEEQLVMTGRLREMLGSRGGNWEILTASAFVSMVVPLIVFFTLQKYLVRGLLAGSVKGG